jgi:hypothetical protein
MIWIVSGRWCVGDLADPKHMKRVEGPACHQKFNLGAWGQHGKTLKKIEGKWVCSRSGKKN